VALAITGSPVRPAQSVHDDPLSGGPDVPFPNCAVCSTASPHRPASAV
jgi:hypothetical protein